MTRADTLKRGLLPLIGLLIAGVYATCPELFQSPSSHTWGICLRDISQLDGTLPPMGRTPSADADQPAEVEG